jgi:hydroxyacylglutathione hydrolase
MIKLMENIIGIINRYIENKKYIQEIGGIVMTQEIRIIELNGVNCYLGKQHDNFVLFDTGGHLFMDKNFTNRREKLIEQLDIFGCNEENLKLIVLTHGDNDHVANAAFIRKKYNAKIAMHSGDIELVKRPTLDKAIENCNYKSIIYKVIFKLIKNKLVNIINKTLDDFERFEPDFYLKEGDDLSQYGFNAKVIYIPGHTPGSIGILTSNNELIAGDIFANMGKKPDIAPNAQDFDILNESVKKLKKMNIKTVYPGHGTPFEMKDFNEIF